LSSAPQHGRFRYQWNYQTDNRSFGFRELRGFEIERSLVRGSSCGNLPDSTGIEIVVL
jgi:hypothetical protein